MSKTKQTVNKTNQIRPKETNKMSNRNKGEKVFVHSSRIESFVQKLRRRLTCICKVYYLLNRDNKYNKAEDNKRKN